MEAARWRQVTTDLESVAASGGDVEAALRQQVPALVAMIERDRATPGLFAAWAESSNFDDRSQSIIVSPAILQTLANIAGLEIGTHTFGGQTRQHANAGLLHCYGYLLSNLQTPHGEKRERWLSDDIAAGFGLPMRTLSPECAPGTLLAHVTAFLRCIIPPHGPVQDPDLKVVRLEEAIGGSAATAAITRRPTTFVTAFAAFPHAPVDTTANAHLLVYAVATPSEPKLRFASTFPVTQAYVDEALSPAGLGEGQAIRPRYNVYVSGLRERYGDKLHGRREVR